MGRSNLSEMEFQLRKLITRYNDIFEYHQWPSENRRWVELIFALITRISDIPEDEIRDIIEELDDLELLNLEALSEISDVKGKINLNNPNARHIFEYLLESGFTKEESKSSIQVMHEVAKSLMKNYDGKIQKYLRKYGQQMIDELPRNFSFSKMSDEDVNYAFTYWLQNVLNMPIRLPTKSFDAFCRKLNVGSDELIEEADRLDINLALVDDMIQLYLDNRKVEKEQEQEDTMGRASNLRGQEEDK